MRPTSSPGTSKPNSPRAYTGNSFLPKAPPLAYFAKTAFRFSTRSTATALRFNLSCAVVTECDAVTTCSKALWILAWSAIMPAFVSKFIRSASTFERLAIMRSVQALPAALAPMPTSPRMTASASAMDSKVAVLASAGAVSSLSLAPLSSKVTTRASSSARNFFLASSCSKRWRSNSFCRSSASLRCSLWCSIRCLASSTACWASVLNEACCMPVLWSSTCMTCSNSRCASWKLPSSAVRNLPMTFRTVIADNCSNRMRSSCSRFLCISSSCCLRMASSRCRRSSSCCFSFIICCCCHWRCSSCRLASCCCCHMRCCSSWRCCCCIIICCWGCCPCCRCCGCSWCRLLKKEAMGSALCCCCGGCCPCCACCICGMPGTAVGALPPWTCKVGSSGPSYGTRQPDAGGTSDRSEL
mmetsp:Transcript_1738/g.4918  ORF Transcript_1738/g.4918 Transcript_1738/m.4918 type:complete len:413 (-) Transcript_1738:844-2082(-)